MATSEADGSQTAVITTEHTLATISTDGSFVLYVDTNAMVDGDELELRAKVKIRSGGTTRTIMLGTFQHAQTNEPNKASIPIASINELVFTLKQTVGTGRAFPWEVVKL